MSSDATADQHRRLADVVEAVEDAGGDVGDVESHIKHSGELSATVHVEIGEDTVDAGGADVEGDGPREKIETDSDPFEVGGTVDENDDDQSAEAVCSECGESHDDGACWDEPDGEESDADDEDGGVEVVDSLQEAMEESDEPDTDTPAGRVLDTLRDEGELAGPELKTLAEVGNVYTAISKLDDDDLIEKRDDPDDGRRTLYRPADWLVDDEEDDGPVWNGRDPEEVVADSSLPARVVLDDILDAVADADTVIEAAKALNVDVDNLSGVCWELTLKQPDSLEIVDGAGDQIETIREVADGE